MQDVVVGPAERSTGDSGVITRAELRTSDGVVPISFETPAGVALARRNLGDVFVAPALLVAMRKGVPLHITDPVSPSLLSSLETWSSIYATWFPTALQRVPIEAPRGRDRTPSRGARGKVGQCMTGGIDSLYSLLTVDTPPDVLVYALGVELADPRRVPTADATARLTEIARRHDRPLVLLHTNVRKVLLDSDLTWGGIAHGAALASIGHLLSGGISTFVIPATHSYATAQPWGSTPWTDPLLSSRSLRVEHHGAEKNRVGKTEAIAHESDVRDCLRVCLKHTSDENCGACRKCVRTMLALDLFGGLAESRRFPQRVEPEVADAITLTSTQDLRHIIDIRDRALELGTRPDILAMCDAMVDRSERAIGALENA